jgi:branched-chain amino acid transport system substrate-binding protein
LLEESTTPLVVLNAATSAIVEKSPYIVRTSFTMWQNDHSSKGNEKQNDARPAAVGQSSSNQPAPALSGVHSESPDEAQ